MSVSNGFKLQLNADGGNYFMFPCVKIMGISPDLRVFQHFTVT